jgi:polyhydroxyalkanoate synthesis regulator phasin
MTNEEMATEEMKRTAEEMKKTGEATAENMRRTGEEFKRAATDLDFKGMSIAWKQGYIGGLEAVCQSQEQTERLLKEAMKQGVATSQQTLSVYEQWLEQIQKHAGPAAPIVEWSRQLVRNFHSNSDQLAKTATDAVESGFSYYADTVSRPTRKYTLDINKKVVETVIPA